ncbi:MAG: response regulator [Methanobacteriota archaeon]|nr:MAG: response regulator [Euryarchaeota archaeon]
MSHQDVILIIEDNPDDIYLLKESFKYLDSPAHLEFFDTGKDAMLFLTQGNPLPSLLLLDLNLPDTDGREILVQIKKDPNLRKIPVVIFSTSNSPKDIEFCLSNYANSYIVKPLEFGELIRILKTTFSYWLEINSMV